MAEPHSAAQEASDPSTSPERLLELTEKHPQLQRLIVLNPSCPEVARDWILATNQWARRAYEESLAPAGAAVEPAAPAVEPEEAAAEAPIEASVWGDLAAPAAETTAPQEVQEDPPTPTVRIAEDSAVVPLGPVPTPAPAPVASPAPAPAAVPVAAPAAAAEPWGYDAPPAPGAAPAAFGTPLAPQAPNDPFPAPVAGQSADPEDDGGRGWRGTWWACGGCLVLALIVLIGAVAVGLSLSGGGDEEEPSSAPATTTQEAPSEVPSEEPTEEPSKDPVSPAPADAVDMTELRSPTGNISCLLEEETVSCSVLEHDFSTSGAEGCADGPFSIQIADGEAERMCGTSFLSDSATALEYDRSATHGDVACTSSFDGMTCWNIMTGKGFMVNRVGYETF